MNTPPVLTITKHFVDLEDPRILKKERHSLLSIIVIAICAVICGADTWVDIEEFGIARIDWFQSFLELPNGIPSHDTFGRVFSVLNADEFGACFLSWVQELVKQTHGQIIPIDGKTVRRSHNAGAGKGAIHMVSAWACTNRVVLGQYKVDEKSNEITAIPALLKLLSIEGSTITIDAMGAQKEIVKQITSQKADYVIGLKENQKSLYEAVADTYTQSKAVGFKNIDHTSYETREKDHGRIEKRTYYAITDADHIDYLNPTGEWANLRSIGIVESSRTIKGHTSAEVRYYLMSSTKGAIELARAVRGHWAIENSLHWVLDIAFREDESRVRIGHADENFSTLRRIALNLIRQQPDKGSVKTKRHRAAWNQAYLLQLLSS